MRPRDMAPSDIFSAAIAGPGCASRRLVAALGRRVADRLRRIRQAGARHRGRKPRPRRLRHSVRPDRARDQAREQGTRVLPAIARGLEDAEPVAALLPHQVPHDAHRRGIEVGRCVGDRARSAHHRVGNFLRKSRLDELPQCIDVLRGDMSVVGPRPERPQFFSMLEREIPFYAERTYGVKPGITGLAQVFLPYDSSVEDVRQKVLHDHAYALRLWRRANGSRPTSESCFARSPS